MAAPAGVSALSTGVLAIYALMMGFAPLETMPILAAILIVCALCQTIAGIIEYKSPPEGGLVISVDEKPCIKTLERAQGTCAFQTTRH